MSEDRIIINKAIVEFIVKHRKELKLTAQQLSEQCKKNKYWLSNIERKHIRTISRKDLNTLCIVLLVDEKEQRIQEQIDELVETYDDVQEHEISTNSYEFQNHEKELKRQLTKAHKLMLSILEKTDFNNKESIEQYEPYLKTFSELFTTDNGKYVFQRLFKYPIQRLDSGTVEKICKLIENENIWKYDIDYDSDNKPYLRITDGADDIFS